MQIESPCNDLNTCQCGHKPTHYSIGYGPTPYSVFCSSCNKSTNRYRSLGGHHSSIISFWNTIAPFHEISASTLIYEFLGQAYIYKEMRSVILAAWDNGVYNTSIYILFSNGRITCDERQFLHKYDY